VRTGTPGGSWWRSCWSAGSCRFSPAATPDKLGELAAARTAPGSTSGPASVDDAASLDRALAGAAAVINCAGPFATTAAPLIEAALRAGIPYVDVAAEIEANLDTFAHFADRARAAGTVVSPRWPSTAASATCWSPPRWATGRRPTRRTSRTA
jgi:hypothetical protein